MSDPMDISGSGSKSSPSQIDDNKRKTVTLSLTEEQLIKLLNIIDLNDCSAQNYRQDPPNRKKKASSWPEWDGSKELYSTFIVQLAAKIEADWDLLGGNKAVCMDMMNTIPKHLRSRVSHWFQTGGPNSDWNYELYINHFNDIFEDKTSVRTANEQLSRMRQGEHQTFSSYLNDFEHTLAQANGINREGWDKINCLNQGLNTRLTNLLMPASLSLSDSNYTLFVKQVRSMAGKLESKEDYVPKRGPRQTTTYHISRLGVAPHIPNTPHQTARSTPQETFSPPLDAEGDTQMSGINGLSASTLAAIINAVNLQSKGAGKGAGKGKGNKPPAPWRSEEEFASLRAAGKCTRCTQTGHYFKNCPRFTWARRPASVNATRTITGKALKSGVVGSTEEDEDFSENE